MMLNEDVPNNGMLERHYKRKNGPPGRLPRHQHLLPLLLLLRHPHPALSLPLPLLLWNNQAVQSGQHGKKRKAFYLLPAHLLGHKVREPCGIGSVGLSSLRCHSGVRSGLAVFPRVTAGLV